MNLLQDQWITVIRLNGSETSEKIAPHQITDGYENNPIVDVFAPRPDFKAALYQFLLGLLHTAAAPDSELEWEDFWDEPPSPEYLEKKFLVYKDCFELDGEGPAFMQDYDAEELMQAELLPVEDIIGGVLSENTRKKNADLFVKQGSIQNISPYWAAIALFTVQINGVPAWGQHRVGLRGNGPLTTLVMLNQEHRKSTLWQKLWLNVLTQEKIRTLPGNLRKTARADYFPWMAKTRVSPKGEITTPQDCHPLQVFWAMPRRIRLQFSGEAETCQLTGEPSENLVTGYRRLGGGVNYSGAWQHPLTPYYLDAKHEKPPISMKGQPGGFCYRHWLNVNLTVDTNQPAEVIKIFIDRRQSHIKAAGKPQLWLFGYDAENANVRCWYESLMPVYRVPESYRKTLVETVALWVDTAVEVMKNLRSAIKTAWFKRLQDAQGDFSFLDSAFWQETEPDFYRDLEGLLDCLQNGTDQSALHFAWREKLTNQAIHLFDLWATSGNFEDMSMKRIIQARNELVDWLVKGKQIKQLAKFGKAA